MSGTPWVVMKVRNFEFEEMRGFGVESVVITNMEGYLPLYMSYEEAKNDFPDGPIVPVKIEDWTDG